MTRLLRLGVVASVVSALVVLASPAFTQGSPDVLALQHKMALIAEAGAPAEQTVNTVVAPSGQTDAAPRFGYRLIVGGLYNPSVFPSETWIYIACLSADPRVAYDEAKFGFSLVRVHALIYELNPNGSLNTATRISTADTSESDEAICDLENGVDTSSLEIPRSFNAQVVTLYSVGSASQNIEVTENVERALPRRP